MAKTKKTSKSSQKASKSSHLGASTIGGLWKHISELAPSYLDLKKGKEKVKVADKLQKMQQEANSSSITELIAENFVRPYLANEKEDVSVQFDGIEKGAFGSWTVLFTKEERKLRINPIGLFQFSEIFKEPEAKLKKAEKSGNFNELRLMSLIKEVSKLPEQYIMLIGILRGVADTTQVCVSDNRNTGSSSDEHTESYLNILWAVKQFEDFYQKVQNRNIRSDYCIIWHEGEWVEGR